MKKLGIITIALAMTLTFAYSTQAMDDHSIHQGHNMAANSEHGGENIQNSMQEGLHLAYHLIDMKAKMKEMNMTMPEMKSHHLMLYVGPHGGPQITDAKVGYVISGPESKQQVMAMAMSDGYGADIDLKSGEEVTIKTKIVTADKTITDEFTYTLK
ncbi:MAG: hypothetical protein KKB30_06780 [Proteobacteria bacterium]|nr:hypothetical protein [Pseudomonadota bacterium]MBU1715422.1 hypothetical protein [Pseudomonadota bacterium]